MTFGCIVGIIACPRHRLIAIAGTGVMADAPIQFSGGAGSAVWGTSTTNRFTEGQTDTSSTQVVERVYDTLGTNDRSLMRIRVPKNRYMSAGSSLGGVVLQNRTVEMVFIVRGSYPSTSTSFPSGIPLLWKAPGWNLVDQLGWTTVSSVFVTVNSSTLQVGVSNATTSTSNTTRFVTWPRPNIGTICILQFLITVSGSNISITSQANINGTTTTKSLPAGGNGANAAVDGVASNPTSLGRGSTLNSGTIAPGDVDWLEFRVQPALASGNANNNMAYYVSKYLTDV